jgi:hypothetical protein
MPFWLVRFAIGLPAREVDRINALNDLPELLEKNLRIKATSSLNRLFFQLHRLRLDDHFLKSLHDWLGTSAHADYDHSTSVTDVQSHTQSGLAKPIDCPRRLCPLRGADRRQREETEANRKAGESIAHPFLKILTGGKGKSTINAFLDLVGQVHKKSAGVTEVIVTDRYLFEDVGERGTAGGYETFIKYLQRLGLKEIDTFTLKVSPAPRTPKITKHKPNAQKERSKPLTDRFTIFEMNLTSIFPNVVRPLGGNLGGESP